jgi:hypothetical protein
MTNVPVAKDGTFFGPHLEVGGYFTVGNKMAEKKFSDFTEALEYLKKEPIARWRRPNHRGHRGIVTAVAWVDRSLT